jgi:hypothetical protein
MFSFWAFLLYLNLWKWPGGLRNEFSSTRLPLKQHSIDALARKSASVAVVQADNRAFNDMFPHIQWALNRTRNWAAAHGYEYIFWQNASVIYPPYWLKVKLLRDALATHDYVIWFDTDAVPACMQYSLADLTRLWGVNRTMLLAPDPPMWGARFMAGVFVIRRTEVSLNMVDFWFSRYNRSHWTLRESDLGLPQWTTPMQWAHSDAYEQGAFVNHILTNGSYASALGVVEWPLFHEHRFPPPSPISTFSYHFSGGFKNTLEKFSHTLESSIICSLDIEKVIVWDPRLRPLSTPYGTPTVTPTPSCTPNATRA